MASTATQPQFRYTQPPSKVIHLRNLPWECTEDELIELGKPFGKVVNTKCNVGANRNQAFIEFADLNQAIAMISYYSSSAEPAQVRGKTVYLQYSNRQEIVNNKSIGDVAGNVLLATIEGVQAHDVSIDVLHLLSQEVYFYMNLNGSAGPCQGNIFNGSLLLQEIAHVFSAFGFVHKIATFEKTAGFQALVQFSDSEIASTARNALDGRSIPRYLLPEHVGICTLRITFSAHTDLNVKFQSHRSRDYTNPFLPVAPSAIDGTGQLTGLDVLKQEPESNVLLASIENMQYAVTIDVLHAVFSTFGFVAKIAIFEKNAGFQALIQYPDVRTAVMAKEALEGHCLYEGGFCKLHLTYSRHTDLNVKINNDRGRDYTGRNNSISNSQPSILGPQPVPILGSAPLSYNSISYPPPSNDAGASSYNSVPYPPLTNGTMVMPQPQPAMSWDNGAGTVAHPLAHFHGQIYMHQPGMMPTGTAPAMIQLAGPPMPPQQSYIH